MDSEDQQYHSIRNEIKNLNQTSIINHLIGRLHLAAHGGMPVIQKGMVPWEMLLLFKWTLMEFEIGNDRLPPVNEMRMNQLQTKISQLFNGNRILFGEDPHRFSQYFRQISFQQFWLQVPISGHGISQQLRLFLDTKRGNNFSQMFFAHFNITLRDYFKVALLLRSYFFGKDKPLIIRVDDLRNLTESFRNRAMRPVLDSWSLELGAAKAFARQDFKRFEVYHQLYEQSPFKKLTGREFCYHLQC